MVAFGTRFVATRIVECSTTTPRLLARSGVEPRGSSDGERPRSAESADVAGPG
jgi:hypothetical protein